MQMYYVMCILVKKRENFRGIKRILGIEMKEYIKMIKDFKDELKEVIAYLYIWFKMRRLL